MFKHQLRALQTKGLWLCAAAAMLGVAASGATAATILYSTDFKTPTYADGALIGQDGWTITGTSVVNPLTVASAAPGTVTMNTTGQDAFRAFTPAVTAGSVYLNADFTVTAAAATGDYFLHLGDGTTTDFYSRLYVKSSGAGFVMAMGTSSGTAVNYGAVLNLNQAYHLVARYDFVPGATNDTGALYINPADPILAVGDVPYIAATTTGTDASTISSVNLRQGTTGSAANVIIDKLGVAVPEPASLALASIGLGLVGLFAARRK